SPCCGRSWLCGLAKRTRSSPAPRAKRASKDHPAPQGLPDRRDQAERLFASSTESVARPARSRARPTNESSALTPSTRAAPSSSRTRVGRRSGPRDRGVPSKSWLPAPPSKQTSKQSSKQTSSACALRLPRRACCPNFGRPGDGIPVSSRALAASYFRPQPRLPSPPVRGATLLGDLNENRRHSSSEHRSASEQRDIDCAGLCPNARKGREAFRVGAADRRAEAEGSRGGEGVQSRARQDTGQEKIRLVGECALGPNFRSARGTASAADAPQRQSHRGRRQSRHARSPVAVRMT